MCRKRLSSQRCRSELIDSAWVVIVPGHKNALKKLKKRMMLTVIPFIKQKTIIPRVKVSKSEIENAGRITISEFLSSGPSFVYQTLHESSSTHADRCQINLMWKASLVFKNPRPAWFGTMQLVYRGSHSERSSFLYLPLIDNGPY